MRCNAALGWAVYRNLLIVVSAPTTPSTSEWSEYYSDVSQLSIRGTLVTGEGKLTPSQRADIAQWQKRVPHPSALLTGSMLSRGMVTALNWFGVPVKAFALYEMTRALDYLRVEVAHQAEVAGTLARLQTEFDARRVQGARPG